MSKKSIIEREKRRERLVKNNFEKRKVLREKSKDIKLSEEERHEASIALNKMRRDTSPSRLRNRCQLSGRPRGYYRKFKISRLAFREMACAGLIPGITKSSW